MTVKCYYKPTRSTPRLFTTKDLARIACKLKEQGADDAQILEAALSCSTINLCGLLSILTALKTILSVIAQILVVGKLKDIAEWLLRIKEAGEVLQRTNNGRIRLLGAILLLLVANASAIEKAYDAITTNIEQLELILNVLLRLCKAPTGD